MVTVPFSSIHCQLFLYIHNAVVYILEGKATKVSSYNLLKEAIDKKVYMNTARYPQV